MGLIKSSLAPSTSPFSMADIERHAKGLLLRARQQAEQLLAEAQSEGESIRAQAKAEGFVEGRGEGLAHGLEQGRQTARQQALEEFRTQLQQSVQALTAALNQLNADRAALESAVLGEVVRLALAIARRVTKVQGAIDPQVLKANLRESIGLVVKSCDLRIAIHPSQRQALDAALPQLQLQWPNLAHVSIVEDPALAPGGCRLFTGQGEIDADLNVQLDRVAAELLPASAGPPGL